MSANQIVRGAKRFRTDLRQAGRFEPGRARALRAQSPRRTGRRTRPGAIWCPEVGLLALSALRDCMVAILGPA